MCMCVVIIILMILIVTITSIIITTTTNTTTSAKASYVGLAWAFVVSAYCALIASVWYGYKYEEVRRTMVQLDKEGKCSVGVV